MPVIQPDLHHFSSFSSLHNHTVRPNTTREPNTGTYCLIPEGRWDYCSLSSTDCSPYKSIVWHWDDHQNLSTIRPLFQPREGIPWVLSSLRLLFHRISLCTLPSPDSLYPVHYSHRSEPAIKRNTPSFRKFLHFKIHELKIAYTFPTCIHPVNCIRALFFFPLEGGVISSFSSSSTLTREVCADRAPSATPIYNSHHYHFVYHYILINTTCKLPILTCLPHIQMVAINSTVTVTAALITTSTFILSCYFLCTNQGLVLFRYTTSVPLL